MHLSNGQWHSNVTIIIPIFYGIIPSWDHSMIFYNFYEYLICCNTIILGLYLIIYNYYIQQKHKTYIYIYNYSWLLPHPPKSPNGSSLPAKTGHRRRVSSDAWLSERTTRGAAWTWGLMTLMQHHHGIAIRKNP